MIRRHPILLWLPVVLVLASIVFHYKAGVQGPTVHWANSAVWSVGYVLTLFLPGYVIGRLIHRPAHPFWAVLAGLPLALFTIFWNL